MFEIRHKHVGRHSCCIYTKFSIMSELSAWNILDSRIYRCDASVAKVMSPSTNDVKIQPLGGTETRRANDPRPRDDSGLLIKWQLCQKSAFGSPSIGWWTWLMQGRRDVSDLHIEHQSFRWLSLTRGGSIEMLCISSHQEQAERPLVTCQEIDRWASTIESCVHTPKKQAAGKIRSSSAS